MPRKKETKKKLVCPKCGSTDIEVLKTWQLVSPFPDRKGRITITVMGVVQCRRCGYKWRTVISKIKVGGSEVELEGAGGKKKLVEEEEEPRRVKEIVLDLEDILEEEE